MSKPRPRKPRTSFPVVGVGASAGGLEAFTRLLGHLPPDGGMAFVLIQHLDPLHTSMLAEALGRATKMTVSPVTDGLRMKPSCVYVIPPNADVALADGLLTLLPRPTDTRRPHLPIDFFFRTLAAERGNQAIGVVLSGTASDGTAGLRAIKAADGITFVQQPESAKFAGMPQSAIDAGVADYVLPLDRLAEELVRLSHHPYLISGQQEQLWKRNDGALRKIFVLVRDAVGVDYSEYKPATLERRLARRMAVCKATTPAEYLKVLLEKLGEAEALYEDVLIHVTSLFRDPEVFEKLKTKVFPQILAGKPDDAPIRVWVAGCSTGEEVYTIAIALLELLADKPSRPIQIFGSDISEKAIDVARLGIYPDAAVHHLSEERRRRFFIKVDRGYQINRAARELCVFVRHDLARDPPFSKLDLVSCRNVLIYFGLALQKRILATFHYCINRPGFLLLGRTESVSALGNFFTPVDKRDKIFARSATVSTLRFLVASDSRPGSAAFSARARSAGVVPRGPDLTKHIDRMLLGQYAPPGVVVNDKLEILQYRGHTGAFLEAAPGEPQQNLLRMCREGLVAPLRFALGEALKKGLPVRRRDVEVRQKDAVVRCDVVVLPILGLADPKERLFSVLFEQPTAVEAKPARKLAPPPAKSRRSPSLEYELASTKEYLQSVLEEHARTNDDLASANEEFVSNNEELQSMNEELETAKEEIQSTNEELSTVNDELHSRNTELNQVNADLINLLDTVDIPMLILDAERRIRRFTPKARRLLNVLQSDIGRLIDDIKPNVNVDLEHMIAETIASATIEESEVQDREGRWYRMQIRPYKTSEGQSDGAILSLIDIDALKHNVSDAEWARDYAAGIVDAMQVPFLVLDENLHVISANNAFYRTFDLRKTATEEQGLFVLDGGSWSIPALRSALAGVVADDTPLQDLELEHTFPRLGAMTLRFAACNVHLRTRVPLILLAIEDISARRRAEDERGQLLAMAQAAKAQAERANAAKDEFLATLSHELRTPLSAMLLQAQLLRRGNMDAAKLTRASELIERNTKLQVQLIEDLLDVSRIASGKLSIQLEPVSLAAVVEAALESVAAQAEDKAIRFEIALDPAGAKISGDPTRLQQVVWNLLTNAIKFSRAGGVVGVTLASVDGMAVLRVRDSGKGIEAGFLPKIFERFTQEDGSSTRTHGGLGIGLAIVRDLVELQGGTVRAESAGVGKGATFAVSLPLLVGRHAPAEAGAALPTPRSAAPTREYPKLDGLRVLVVDDDASMRESTAELLSSTGAEVRSADSAADALEAIEAFHPQILVCDIAMPGEDGLSFMRRLRKLRTPGNDIPAIALTALAGERDRNRSLAAGFQEHLSKPIDGFRLAQSLALLAKREVAVE